MIFVPPLHVTGGTRRLRSKRLPLARCRRAPGTVWENHFQSRKWFKDTALTASGQKDPVGLHFCLINMDGRKVHICGMHNLSASLISPSNFSWFFFFYTSGNKIRAEGLMLNLQTFISFTAVMLLACTEPSFTGYQISLSSAAVRRFATTDLIKGVIVLFPLIANASWDQYAFYTCTTSRRRESRVNCIVLGISSRRAPWIRHDNTTKACPVLIASLNSDESFIKAQ